MVPVAILRNHYPSSARDRSSYNQGDGKLLKGNMASKIKVKLEGLQKDIEVAEAKSKNMDAEIEAATERAKEVSSDRPTLR